MSMAAIEKARLSECERLLREYASLVATMQRDIEWLKTQAAGLRPTLSVKKREAAQPV